MSSWKTHPETFARSAFIVAGFVTWGAFRLLQRIAAALERIAEALAP